MAEVSARLREELTKIQPIRSTIESQLKSKALQVAECRLYTTNIHQGLIRISECRLHQILQAQISTEGSLISFLLSTWIPRNQKPINP